MTTGIKDRIKSTCVRCHKILLLNNENLCISCENDVLYEKNIELDLQISAIQRRNSELLNEIAQYRRELILLNESNEIRV